MVTAMNGIEKHAAFYRAYLADDRSLASVVGILMTAIMVWLLFYLVSIVGPVREQSAARPSPRASVAVSAPAHR
ncbi:hypothetical protein [Roseiarcus sp.]|jgi:hypothetical protein|uniref:hypothetical protein n=1 Tax=Roseiarcus sp. TaxID=1969460 RepID=UPI003F99C03C